MKHKKESADVGVIVGRFQVDQLHEAHKDLIQSVMNESERVIVFLGLSPARVTRNNPLDFESRKQMLIAEYPDLNVLYIKDVNSDEVWSRVLDERIGDMVGPTDTVKLYGSRESFIDHYVGKYSTCELEQEVFVSGTEIRNKISKRVKGTPEFSQGVIWAAHNQYPKVYTTVDIAIWNEDGTQLLLARKENEDKYRFVGGFLDSRETLEQAARRECNEETTLEISDPQYLGSFPIDDWRYRRELDSITTVFFEAKRVFGKPTPCDDIVELKWFEADTLNPEFLVEGHRQLLQALIQRTTIVPNRSDQS